MLKRMAVLIVVLAFAPAPAIVSGQSLSDSGTHRQTPAAAAPSGKSPSAAVPRHAVPKAAGSATPTAAPDLPATTNSQPQIIVTSPAPAPTVWTLHDRIAWGAMIVLAFLGYVGILLALRTLKSIERHTENGATTAQAALDAAQAALEQTQAMVRSERPWIVITVEPFLTLQNSFKVMATNRGRTPARIIGTVDRVTIAADEKHLPQEADYENPESSTKPESIILLPGESAGIRAFSRDDVRGICKTAETLERIKLWQDSIFLYGRVAYVDMISPQDDQIHQTDWCCRYIHGEKNSALMIAGPPEYHKHT